METGESPRTSRWRRLACEVLPLLVLLSVSCKATFDEWRARDLTPTDETWYLSLAWQMSDPNAPPAETNALYVPLYVGWYQLLLRLPIEVEYLPHVCHAVLMTLLACVFYALVRRLGTGRWMSVVAAAVLFHCTKLAEVEPFPVHMATVVFALGVVVGTFRRSTLGACGPIGFAALVACYTRNEFGTFLLVFLPSYLLFGLWMLWRGAPCRREFLPWAIPLALTVGTCAVTLGLPMPDGPRGVFAFGQHYVRNVVEAKGGEVLDWVVNYPQIVIGDFGEVRSFGDCVRARPGAVAWHVGQNLQRLPKVVFDLFRARTLLKPDLQTPVQVLLLVVLSFGLVRTLRRVWSSGLRGPEEQPLCAVVLALACLGLISGPSVLLVFPREHYLLLPLFFVLALAVSGLPEPRWSSGWLGEPTRWKVRALGFAAALLLLGGIPTAIDKRTCFRPLVAQYRQLPSCEQRKTMALLRTLPRRPGTVVLDHRFSSTFLTAWMAQPVVLISYDQKAEGFCAFVAKHDLQVIVLQRELLREPAFGADPEFMALWNETDTGPFVVLASGDARIAVRRDLVPRD